MLTWDDELYYTYSDRDPIAVIRSRTPDEVSAALIYYATILGGRVIEDETDFYRSLDLSRDPDTGSWRAHSFSASEKLWQQASEAEASLEEMGYLVWYNPDQTAILIYEDS